MSASGPGCLKTNRAATDSEIATQRAFLTATASSRVRPHAPTFDATFGRRRALCLEWTSLARRAPRSAKSAGRARPRLLAPRLSCAASPTLVVVEALGQQGALRAVSTFNKTSHRQLSSARWYKSIESEGFHTAWARSCHYFDGLCNASGRVVELPTASESISRPSCCFILATSPIAQASNWSILGNFCASSLSRR